MYPVLRPNQSDNGPTAKTPIMLPRKKAIWMIRLKYWRSQTRSHRCTAESYSKETDDLTCNKGRASLCSLANNSHIFQHYCQLATTHLENAVIIFPWGASNGCCNAFISRPGERRVWVIQIKSLAPVKLAIFQHRSWKVQPMVNISILVRELPGAPVFSGIGQKLVCQHLPSKDDHWECWKVFGLNLILEYSRFFKKHF